MSKTLRDLTVKSVEIINERYVLLRLTDDEAPLPSSQPGQFVQVKVDGSPSTFLRRPISIHFTDTVNNELWLMIRMVGEGTHTLSRLSTGDRLNVLLPLGNGFPQHQESGETVLLVGGGVGAAPLLEYGKFLHEHQAKPIFLLGGRTADDLFRLPMYEQYGPTHITTEDGSMGEKGFVTQHSILKELAADRIVACGPKPMMVAVAKYAKQTRRPCWVSLENMMACGIGACLCCVEKTVRGNVCVCTDGPVFNITELTWQI